MLEAAALASIIDPERKVPGWWTPCWTSPEFGGTPVENLPSVCKFNDWYYTGPPDLHTAREHNWRLEDWLEARGYSVLRQSHGDGFAYTVVRDQNLDVITNDPNHTAALVAAIERIAHNARNG